MNILILSHGIPSRENPQWGCFELTQARALVALGHKVTIAVVDGRLRRRRVRWGITCSDFGGIHAYLYYLLPLNLLVFPALKRKVRSWMTRRLFDVIFRKEGTPDIIYAHYLFAMAGLESVHRHYPDIPVVGIEHWSRLTKDRIPRSDRIKAGIGYNLVDRLLAVSLPLQLRIKKCFGKDADVVNDMVDDVFFAPHIGKDRPHEPFRFISVGSLIERKGFDILIRAFAGMADRKTALTIVGDGPARKSLTRLCERLGVGNRVSFVGCLPHEAIAGLMSGADAYAQASRAETFGVSYAEAMAMGLPVIATRCGGPESFMDHTSGLLVDVDDVNGLTDALDRMVAHIGDYDPTAIRECARSRFSGDVIAGQLEKIFEEEIKNV